MTSEQLQQKENLPVDTPAAAGAEEPRPTLRAFLKAAHRKGMTLIEIMIVITIMAAIMGVVGWAVIGQSEKANIELAETQLNNLKNGVKSYYVSYRKYPDGLQDLVDTPDGFKIIEEVPVDPWGSEYQMERSGKNVKLSSPGPDETPNNDDDIVVELKP